MMRFNALAAKVRHSGVCVYGWGQHFSMHLPKAIYICSRLCSPQSILIYTHKNVHPDFLPNKVPTLAVPLLATLNSLPKAYNYHGFVTCLHDQHCVQVRGVNQ